MDPAPAFSARGRRGGRVHRRKLYYEAFDELTCWARREFQVGVARVPWEEASDLHRSSLLAWQADFTEESYRHLRDIYPDLYDAVIARGRHQPIQFTNTYRPQLKALTPAQPQQQPSAPSSPASTTAVSTIKAAAPSAAQTQAATGIRLQLQAQRFHQEPQLRARPDLHPIRLQLRVGEGTLLRGGPHRGGRGHRRQGDNLFVYRCGRR